MTTPTKLNDLLNLIKIRIRYMEWKLSLADEGVQINECFEGFLEIARELNCILNLSNLSNRDRITTSDYLAIINNIMDTA
jgi:hypothetical protein